MKKIFTLFVAAMAAVNLFAAWSGSGQGVQVDGQWYALYDTSEKNFSTISSKEYTLQAPAAALTYEAKCVPITVIVEYYGGELKVGQYVNGQWSNVLFSQQPPKNSYASYGPVDLSYDATKVRLYTTTGATGKKYMKNVFATMATYLEAPSVSSLEFGQKTMPIEPATESLTFTLPWCNTEVSTVLAGEGSEHISVSSDVTAEAGHYATSTYTVSYDRSVAGNLNATLTIAGAGQTYTIAITGETVALPTTYGEYSAAFCEGDSIEYNGVWYKEAFIGDVTLAEKNHLGGDSIVTLTVTVNPTFLFEDEQIVIEEGTDSLWHEIQLSVLEVGEHVLYDSLKVAETGCDSVWSVVVTVEAKEPVGPTTAIDETTLAPAATKFFRNGSLYIRRGEALYDMSGRKVK